MPPKFSYTYQRIIQDAPRLAMQIAAGEARNKIAKTYQCSDGLLRRAMTKAGYGDCFGTRKTAAQRRAMLAEARHKQQAASAIEQLKSANRRTVYMCKGCGDDVDEVEGACRKCGSIAFEQVNVLVGVDA